MPAYAYYESRHFSRIAKGIATPPFGSLEPQDTLAAVHRDHDYKI